LHGAFLETMRLHPTAFGLVRGASRDFEFAGHRVPVNRHVLFYTTMCHKLDKYFPNAKTFDIDRSLPERNEYAQRGVFAPFGRGPHKCLGAGWADAQALLTVGTILYHYELALPANMRDIRPRLRTTPTLGPKFTVRLKNRRHR
jgi:cytochrome P450